MQLNENYSWLYGKDKTNGNSELSETKTEPSAKEEAEISVQEIRNRYSERVRENFEAAANKLKAERDDALRENWILQQQEEAALPERVAASGLNGGASETGLAALKARFQGNRNEIRDGYMDNLGELLQKQNSEQAENEDKYNRQWLEYLLSLAKMEAEK